jgi:hypothetical protein
MSVDHGWMGDAWKFLPVGTAALVLWSALLGWWRRTIGLGYYTSQRYRRIAPGVCHEHVAGMFGSPTWQHPFEHADHENLQNEKTYTIRTWALGSLAYLTTWCDPRGTVILHTLITRSRFFRPKFALGYGGPIRLGKTHLSQVRDQAHVRESVPILLNSWHGHADIYQPPRAAPGRGSFIVGYSPVGTGEATPPFEVGPELDAFRATTRINSVTAIASFAEAFADKGFVREVLGPEPDLVDLMPLSRTRLKLQRLRKHAAALGR